MATSTTDNVGEQKGGNVDPNQPWWAKLFIQVGFPTALAVLLVAALLGWMPSPIMRSIDRLEYNAWRQTMIMTAICQNLDGREKKVDCFPWKQ